MMYFTKRVGSSAGFMNKFLVEAVRDFKSLNGVRKKGERWVCCLAMRNAYRDNVIVIEEISTDQRLKEINELLD